MLCEPDTHERRVDGAGAEYDESGGCANEESVDVDAECLYESLLDGVRYGGCCGGVGGGAFAGFVAEEPALDAHDEPLMACG